MFDAKLELSMNISSRASNGHDSTAFPICVDPLDSILSQLNYKFQVQYPDGYPEILL